jgi:hypothetical protein
MNQEYLEIASNYSSSSRFSHCIGYIKNLPFKDSSDSLFNSLKTNSKNILLPFGSIKQYLETDQFHMIAIQDNEEITARYRLLNEMNIIKKIKPNFTQLSVLAKEAGVDYADLLADVNQLELINEQLLKPLKRTIDYSQELLLICPYLIKSKSLPTYDNYLNMLKDLNEEYDDILHNGFYDKIELLKHEMGHHMLSFNNILDKLLERIQEKNPEILSTMSSRYSNELNNSTGDISQFLLDKTFDETIQASIKLEDNQKVQAYIVFKDNSIAVKTKGQFSAINTMSDLDNTFMGLKESIVAYKLKKRPQIAKLFIELARESIHFDKCMIAIDTFINNEQILKNMKMDLNIFTNKSFEVIDDHMNSLVNEHKTNQYANSILSNKNKHLLTPVSIASFKLLREMNVTEQELQKAVGKKMAAIKTSEDLESYLVKVLGQYTGFSHEAVSSKLERASIKPVYDNGDVLVFPVTEYKHSKELGSPSWCIVREESYFKTYTDYNQKQYFMYDFSKNEKDNDSLIGFTLTKDGNFHTQHLRDDDYLSVDEKLQHIADTIMFNHKDEFNLSEKKLASLDKMFETTLKKQINKNKQGV